MITQLPVPVGQASLTFDNTAGGFTGDAGPLFQNAINSLRAKGGQIAIRGTWTLNTPITLYPGIGLVGQGQLSTFPTLARAATIFSTVAGSSIVCTGDSSASLISFPWIANIVINGTGAVGGQNGIEFNDSNGNLFDIYLDEVGIFQMGQHCIFANSTNCKSWIRACYIENSGGDGINHVLGFVNVFDSYIHGNAGRGIFTSGGAGVRARGNDINSNAGPGIFQQSMTADCEITNNRIANNGSNANPQVNIRNWNMAVNADTGLTMTGNTFTEDRAIGSAAIYHVQFGGNPMVARGVIDGNYFGPGTSSGLPLLLIPATSGNNDLIIANNRGLNNTLGKIATPFATATAGIEGAAAAPTASTTYAISGTPVFLASSGGTGVSITIKDPAGNTLISGAATFNDLLPVGYSINFGAFTVAPTVTASVA